MTLDRKTAGIYGAFALAVVATAALVFFKLLPERRALEAARADAEEATVEAERARADAAGPNFKEALERFAADRRRKVDEFEAARRRSALKLSAWFPEMTIPQGAKFPARDEFQRAYAFHRDRMGNAVRDLLMKSGAPDVGQSPMMKPAFLGGLPPKEEEMIRWQRLANVEKLFLEAAARHGAFALVALEAESEARPPGAPDDDFERYRIRGSFATTTRRVTDLLNALVAAGDESGCLARLDGVAIAPAGPEVPHARSEEPNMRVDVSLSCGFPVHSAKGDVK